MKRFLLLLGMSTIVGCSGAAGVEDIAGDEQAVVAGADGSETVGHVATGGGKTSTARAVDTHVIAFSHEEQEGPADPFPWRLPPDEPKKDDAPTK